MSQNAEGYEDNRDVAYLSWLIRQAQREDFDGEVARYVLTKLGYSLVEDDGVWLVSEE